MKYKQIVKEFGKIASKHGISELESAIGKIYGVEIFRTLGDPPPKPPAEGCGSGYVWSQTLGRCIPDPG